MVSQWTATTWVIERSFSSKASTLPEDDNNYFYPAFGLSFVLSDAIDALRDSGTYIKLTVSSSTVYNDLGAFEINESYFKAEGFPYASLNGFFKDPTAVDDNMANLIIAQILFLQMETFTY